MKKKTKKEIRFDPADYDYMDKIPLEGYIWEFIRRSNEYKEICKIWTNVSGLETFNYAKKLLKMGIMFFTYSINCKAYGVLNKNYFLFPKDGNNNFAIPKPEINPIEFGDRAMELIINQAQTFYVVSLDWLLRLFGVEIENYEETYKPLKKTNKPVEILKELLKRRLFIKDYKDTQNTFVISLSRFASVDDLENKLIPYLKPFLKSRKTRIRDDKWKYYLITYDLKSSDSDIKDPEIADILSEAYPSKDPDKVFSDKNIEGYYEKALALINGGYKKYLFIEK